VSPAPDRPVRLPGRRAAADRTAPGQPCRGTDTKALEGTVSRRSAALSTKRDRRSPEELRVVAGYPYPAGAHIVLIGPPQVPNSLPPELIGAILIDDVEMFSCGLFKYRIDRANIWGGIYTL